MAQICNCSDWNGKHEPNCFYALTEEVGALRSELRRMKHNDEQAVKLTFELHEANWRIDHLRAEVKDANAKWDRLFTVAKEQLAEVERLRKRCEEAREIISQCSLSGSAHWFALMAEKREKWLEGKP